MKLWPKTKKGRIRLIFWTLFAIALAIYVFGGFLERKLVFYPTQDVFETPESRGLTFEDVTLRASDDTALHGWWVPHPKARATVLFSHGNAGNISYRGDKLEILHGLGVSVLMYDYRGYGKSKGSPTEPGMYLDAQAAYDWLVKTQKIAPKQIIAYGESLGGTVSAHLAAGNEVGGVILDSTFSNIEDMARHHYPMLAPIRQLDFNALANIPKAKAPTLVLHSPQDDIVPYEQGKRLFAAANEPKQFVELQGDHNGGFLFNGGRIYTDGLRKFLDAHFPGK